MDDAHFWTLIDQLEGVADEESVARLEARLAPEEVEGFGAVLEEKVEELLASCTVPESHGGEHAEVLAAAVVAAGRTAFDSTRAAGGALDPSAWRWQEAEPLLYAGLDEGATWADEPFTVQWLTDRLPEGVTSGWLPGSPDYEDPEMGRVPATDAAWDAAREALQVDPGVAAARQEIGARFGAEWDAVHVWLVLRDDLSDPDITLYTMEGDTPEDTGVVITGTVPTDDLRELDGVGRTSAYLELVTGLLQVVLEDS